MCRIHEIHIKIQQQIHVGEKALLYGVPSSLTG